MRSLGVSFITGIVLSFACFTATASAWTGATTTPPAGNTSAPLNVGSTNQVKTGSIGMSGLAVFGDSLFSGLGTASPGTGRYLNFDYTTLGSSGTGSAGYGIRDSAGTLQFKNSGGSWQSLNTVMQTYLNLNSIYFSGGFVGIGKVTPTVALDVTGDVRLTGKLYVSTVDPVYSIDGANYATYGASSVGIREDLLTTVTLSTLDPASGKYVYDISFDSQKKGNDLWLFYQVTDFGKDWNSLVVMLSPGFDGHVYYQKLSASHTLRIVSDAPGEVSVHFSADRFDAAKWPTLITDPKVPAGLVVPGK